MLLHVCQRRAWAKQTADEHSRIAGADPKSWGSPSKVYPIPSAASFLTFDACDRLCVCCVLRACLLLVSDGDQHAMHQLMPLATSRQPI